VDERDIQNILSQDLAKGTDQFRDDLLKRCLALIPQEGEAVELGDSELEMLSAAGDASSVLRVLRNSNGDTP
jgi:hypothetical protein